MLELSFPLRQTCFVSSTTDIDRSKRVDLSNITSPYLMGREARSVNLRKFLGKKKKNQEKGSFCILKTLISHTLIFSQHSNYDTG